MVGLRQKGVIGEAGTGYLSLANTHKAPRQKITDAYSLRDHLGASGYKRKHIAETEV